MSLFLGSLLILTVAGFLMLASAGFKRICGYIFLASLTAAGGMGLLCAIAILCQGVTPPNFRLSWPLPWGEFYIGIDSLSAFFLLVVFFVSAVTGIYGYGYLRDYAGPRSLGAHYFFYHLLVISVALILAAKNAVLFLVAWELMTVASYFLMTFYDEKESVTRAGYIYLIATHTGTFCLLVMFLLMGSQAGSLNFDRMAAVSFPLAVVPVLFALAFVGFGVKAGLIPFHIWLPHAHPAAPSHISALLSGVVIKIGIYGLMRVFFMIKDFPWWCGTFIVLAGAVSGVGGVLYALGQHEIKKLLAYHSIENIGIIALGLGMGLLGRALHQDTVALLGYTGALLHVFNHAVFKGLLFLSAGSVIRATHTGEIDHMGGLLKSLPWTGHLFLIGSLSICGLPFFNGFISEWLVYQAFLRGVFHFDIQGIIVSCLAVVSLALIGGLAAFCFAKAFGTIFLGKNRSAEVRPLKENGLMLCGPMIGLAAVCVWIGLFPTVMVSFALEAARTMTGAPIPPAVEETVLNPLLAVIGALSVVVIIFAVLALLRGVLLRGRLLRWTETWSCGYAMVSPRMQYTASSLTEPLLRIFRVVLSFQVKTQRPVSYFPAETQLSSQVLDASEHLLFRPVLYGIKKFSRKLNWIQGGHTQRYLLYIFFFLLILLLWKLG